MFKRTAAIAIGLLLVGGSSLVLAQQPDRASKPVGSKKAAPAPAGTRGIVVEGAESPTEAPPPAAPASEGKVTAKPVAPVAPAAKPVEPGPPLTAEKPPVDDKPPVVVKKPPLKEKPVVRAKPHYQPHYGYGRY